MANLDLKFHELTGVCPPETGQKMKMGGRSIKSLSAAKTRYAQGVLGTVARGMRLLPTMTDPHKRAVLAVQLEAMRLKVKILLMRQADIEGDDDGPRDDASQMERMLHAKMRYCKDQLELIQRGQRAASHLDCTPLKKQLLDECEEERQRILRLLKTGLQPRHCH